MLKIGLTGGIASGKSTVLDFFKKKNVPYIDADVVAREVVDLGTPGLAAIRELFGDTVILDDGRLNREALGSIVFHNEEKRLQLNSCLHGFIRQRIDELSAMYEEKAAPAVIYDIPLLLSIHCAPLIGEPAPLAIHRQAKPYRVAHTTYPQ